MSKTKGYSHLTIIGDSFQSNGYTYMYILYKYIYIQIPTNGWMTIPQYWKSTLVLTTAYMYFESTETVTGV